MKTQEPKKQEPNKIQKKIKTSQKHFQVSEVLGLNLAFAIYLVLVSCHLDLNNPMLVFISRMSDSVE